MVTLLSLQTKKEYILSIINSLDNGKFTAVVESSGAEWNDPKIKKNMNFLTSTSYFFYRIYIIAKFLCGGFHF